MKLIAEKFKNTNKQGDAGLGIAIGWFSMHDYTVSIPLTDSQDYDLIVDNGVGLLRVQVKTTTYKRNSNYRVDLRVKGGNKSGTGKIKKFDHSKADAIFAVTGDGTKYLIPTNRFTNTGQISLCEIYEEFKLGRSEQVWDKVLNEL